MPIFQLHVNLSIPKNEKDENYETHLPQGIVNLCTLSDGILMNPIAKMFLDTYEKYANYKIACPFKPGPYNLYGYEMKENLFSLPMIKNFKFRLSASLHCKTAKEKKNFEAFRFKMDGSIKN